MTQLQRCKRNVVVRRDEARFVKRRRRRQERHKQNAAILNDLLPTVPMPYIS